MSSNTNPLPPGTNYIGPCILSLMVGQTFLVLLIPLLVALFYYSTPYSRCQPIFILNVIALTLAFAVGLVTNAMTINIMLSPQNIWPAQTQLSIALGFIIPFQGMLADVILLVRLITVHPPSRIGLARFVLLTSVPIILKVARLVNLILYTDQLSIMANGPNGFEMIAYAWLTGPYMKIEWIAQVVDNSYASIAFLWTIWGFRTNTVADSRIGAVTFRQTSLAERLRILFNFALSNFIIPTLFSIVQLALIFQFGETDANLMNEITYANAMISVFGVVFATVWAGKVQRRGTDTSPDSFSVEQEWKVCSQPHIADTANVENHHGDNASDQVPGIKYSV